MATKINLILYCVNDLPLQNVALSAKLMRVKIKLSFTCLHSLADQLT